MTPITGLEELNSDEVMGAPDYIRPHTKHHKKSQSIKAANSETQIKLIAQLGRGEINSSWEGGKRSNHEPQPTRIKARPRSLKAPTEVQALIGPETCGGALVVWLV